jgi:uncharacterized membrane protein YkoI
MTELKTLKDFEEGECESCALEYGAYQEEKKYPRLISEDELRQEAIKHAKGVIKEIDLTPEELFMTVGKLRFIKYFFNITDEELK